MSDSRASVKIDFTIYGENFTTDMWINWAPAGDCDVDQRVLDWFSNCYWSARAKWDNAIAECEAHETERREREELARLQAKYQT